MSFNSPSCSQEAKETNLLILSHTKDIRTGDIYLVKVGDFRLSHKGGSDGKGGRIGERRSIREGRRLSRTKKHQAKKEC